MFVFIFCFFFFLFSFDIHSIPAFPQNGDIVSSLGVNIHFTQPQANEVKMLAEGGWKWIRTDLAWDVVEKSKGVYNFSEYDILTTSLDQYGVKALFVLDYGNPLYDSGNAPYTDEGRTAFANFVLAAVAKYQKRGYIFELWNEPDLPYAWKPTPNAADYVKLALAVGSQLKQHFPDETFVGAGTSGFNFQFITTLLSGGVLKYFDAFSIHGYGQNPPEEWINSHAKLRTLIDKYKPANKTIPILCSEWGHSLLTPKISPEEQAAMLVRDYLVTLSTHAPVTIWYDWHDDCTDQSNNECWFGTVQNQYFNNQYPPYVPKPAYNATQVFSKMLKNYAFSHRILNSDKYAYQFTNVNGNAKDIVLLAWGNSGTASIPLAQDQCFQKSDLMGKSLGRVCSSKKKVDVQVSEMPIYLKSEL